MRDSWFELIDVVLRPARRRLVGCLSEREVHLTDRRVFHEQRARAKTRCEARIEDARAAVFAAQDGVVSSLMTDLEREWRRLSRPDPQAGVMELWARTAPASWIDRKRWRDSDPAQYVDAAIALASDVEGVETAEAAVDALRIALAPWGAPFGARIRWRALEREIDCAVPLLAEPLRAARESLGAREGRGAEAVVLERAQRVEREVLEAASVRFPDRPVLAADLAHAAFVDSVWRAAPLADHANPVTPLRDLWRAGYVLSAIDASGVTVELPPL